MTKAHRPANAPDRDLALAQYRRRAWLYDLELALLEPVRQRAVALLALKRGDTVLDVGCGTGLSLPLLRQAVGARGRIVGIEQSPEMIARARQRVAENRWRNVTLVCASVQAANIRVVASAALFHFTHDILRASDAVAHIARHLEPRARVVASGLKWAPPWAVPVNLFVWPAALYSVTSLEGLRKPWSHLEALMSDLRVESLIGGGVYVASGVLAR